MNTRQNRKALKWLSILLSVGAIAVLYYELKFFDLLLGVYNLEIRGKRIARVSQKTLMYVMRSHEDEDLFTREMEKLGWQFYDQYGRGYLFTKQGEEILATRSQHLGRYQVYEIHNEKYFNYMNGAS
ncbi:MAG: hypothetical protein AVO33_00410 [delta proteobacterium ML8_F1]|nr:MAG: hypothetical protein AVO33_00410 [delta proteobacterium ML8_F1]